MADEKDPIEAMLTIDDEAERNQLPEAELNTDAPEDKKVERDEEGKFKGKEEEKKPEPKVEPKEEKRDETVPLAKFLDKTNKLKEQLDQKDITLKQYEQRLAALEAKLPKPEAPKEPDFVEDPKGYVDTKLNGVLKGIEEANKKAEESGKEAKETAAAANERVQLQQFMSDIGRAEQAFVAQHPDYQDALNHIRGIRAFQLQQFQPDITQEQIAEVIRQEEIGLAVQLARAGKNPITTAYELAQKYGFQPKGKQVETKLPEVPEKKQLPPDQTLGSGSSANDEPYKEGETDPVDLALASVFRKRA
jgi:hypothetical protein